MFAEKRRAFYNALVLVVVLIVLDQGIKHIIRTYSMMGMTVDIIGQFISFHPVLNTLGSWLAAGYGVELGIGTFTVFNIIVIPFLIEGYRFYLVKAERTRWFDAFFLLFIAGAICSLIDKLFFNGSLDFIAFKGLFVSDTKDFYLSIASICLFIGALRSPGPDSGKHIAREYFAFCAQDFKRLFTPTPSKDKHS